MVLPFGVRNQSDIGEISRGTEPGAPIFAKIKQKFLATTVLSAIIMALMYWALSNQALQEYWR